MKVYLTFIMAVTGACFFEEIFQLHAQGYVEAVALSNASGPIYSQHVVGYLNNATIGWEFSSDQDIVISSLGWLEAETDTQVNTDVFVGLWSAAGMLVTSTVIDSNSVLLDGSVYESITPVFIPAGTTMVVAIGSSEFGVSIVGIGGPPTNYPLNFIGNGSLQGDGFAFPTIQTDPAQTENLAIGATFLFQPIPEPGELALSALGGLFLVWHRWQCIRRPPGDHPSPCEKGWL